MTFYLCTEAKSPKEKQKRTGAQAWNIWGEKGGGYEGVTMFKEHDSIKISGINYKQQIQ